MKNSLRRIFALLMAVMMIAALGMSAFAADEGDQTAPATFKLPITAFKTLNKDANAYAPATTYTFTATPITAAADANGTVGNPYAGPAGAISIDAITSTPATTDIAAVGADGVISVTHNGEITITQVAGFDKAGIYRYIVEETPGDYEGITYDNTDRYLDVYIQTGDDGSLSIAGAVLYETDDVLSSDGKTYTDPDEGETAKGGFTNTYATADLTLTKLVDGNLGDRTKDFTFTVTIKGAEGEQFYVTTTRTDGYDAPIVLEEKTVGEGDTAVTTYEKSVTITLKHNESVTIYGLSENDTYTIVEGSYATDGYTATVEGAGTVSTADDGTTTASGTISATPDDVNVTFTNTKDANVPTGIAMTVLPFVAMIALAAIVAVLFFQKRERREA